MNNGAIFCQENVIFIKNMHKAFEKLKFMSTISEEYINYRNYVSIVSYTIESFETTELATFA